MNTEDILYRAHELHLFDEFMNEVKEIRKHHNFKNRDEIYEMALENVIKKKEEKNISKI